MTKFISKKNLIVEDEPVNDEKLLKINVLERKNCKKGTLVDIGTHSKVFFSSGKLKGDSEEKFREQCLRFYQVSTQYLLDHLPHGNKLIKYAQYLHPLKRMEPASTSAISNAALTITQVKFWDCSYFILWDQY